MRKLAPSGKATKSVSVRIIGGGRAAVSLYFTALLVSAVALSACAPTYAATCPTSAVATAKYSVSSQALTSAQLASFNTLRDDGIAKITAYGNSGGPSPVGGGAAVSPTIVADIVAKTAGAELESFALDELVSQLCKLSAPYFPDTCSSTVATGSSGSISVPTQIDSLRTTLRLDIEALPACLIYQRSASHTVYGYLLISVLEQLLSDKTHDYAALIHGVATNAAVALECDDFTTTQNAGCQIYLASVAVDAALIVRSEQRASNAKFTFANMFGTGGTPTAQLLADQFAGSVLADLTLSRCAGGADANVPSDICQSDPLVAWWMKLFGYYRGTDALATNLSALAKVVDQSDGIDDSVNAIVKLEKTLGSESSKNPLTATGGTITNTNMAKLQQLQLQVLTSVPEMISGVLQEFGKFSLAPTPHQLSNRDKQIQQIVAVLSGTSRAYADFQSKDYLDGADQLGSIGIAACKETNPPSLQPEGVCGFLFSNQEAGFPALEVIAFAAQLSGAKDASEFSSMVGSQSGGANSWKAKQTTPMVWLGSYVGIQGGFEHLSGPGYSSTGADYGAFAPLGAGLSWPRGLFGQRPLSAYFSVFDLGSLISTSTAFSSSPGRVSGKAQAGWSQLLAPGFYLATPIIGPIYGGVGYVYRTPDLRSVMLSNGNQIGANSNRVEIFLGVDVTLFYRKY